MKKARRKKQIIENNPKSKQQDKDDDDVNDLLSLIPLDLKTEILSKLPAKSVAKLSFISKSWLSTIRSRDFTKHFLARSSTQPRLLCIVSRRHADRYPCWSQYFHSYSQDHAFSDQHITPSEIRFEFSPPVRGLICFNSDTKVVVCNPTTGQSVTLRGLKTKRSGLVSFLGYEPVHDVYKVLLMTVKGVRRKRGSNIVADEYQVFTFGAGWRLIECKIPHLPRSRTNVLCKNGVVYYYAWINMDGCLISFDLRTEEFDVMKLPEDIRLQDYCNLVDYNGKIALTSESFRGELDLRVLEDAKKQEWSKVYVLVPSWRGLVGDESFWFTGVLSNGELVFSVRSSNTSFYIVCYDPKEDKVRKVVIEGIGDDAECYHAFLDHVESPMYLPKVRRINPFIAS